VLIVVLVLGCLGDASGESLGVSGVEKTEVKSSEGLAKVKAWEGMLGSPDAAVKALRTKPSALQKYSDLVDNNSLGLDASAIDDILGAAARKNQSWDDAEAVLDALRRASDGNTPGLSISH
jgi:hypothetical protein